MLNNLLMFGAEEAGPAIHIEPGELFEVGGLTITNSIFSAWIIAVVVAGLLILAAKRMTIMPKRGPMQFVEIGVDFMTNMITNALGDRQKALKYGPYFIAIFFFIAMSNWIGLLPGFGEAVTLDGVPVFRTLTADLNGTLAIAVVAMIMIQYFAIKESGFLKHLRHYFSGSLKNPMTLFFGVFEMFTELTRVASLALRLFLNIVIGEIIIAVFAYLGQAAAPLTSLPFLTLELFVGGLQAYIFVTLSVTYLAVAVKHGDEHEAEDEEPHTGKLAVEGQAN